MRGKDSETWKKRVVGYIHIIDWYYYHYYCYHLSEDCKLSQLIEFELNSNIELLMIKLNELFKLLEIELLN
jgi:hypothetical protein